MSGMFDLEAQISDWRRSMRQSLGGRPDAGDTVEELESHLRDAVDRLVRSGRTPEQAWPAALAQLGGPEPLAAEFGKLDGRRRAWLPARVAYVLFAAFAACVAWFVASRRYRGGADTLLGWHVLTVTLGYTATFAVGALASWSVLARAVRGADERRAAGYRSAAVVLAAAGFALTAAGVVLGAWWAKGAWGRWWACDVKEVGGLLVLAWHGLVLCLLARRSTAPAAVLAGAAGNIVVSLSWFGPKFDSGGLHDYGRGSGQWLTVFVAAQLVVLCVGCAARDRAAPAT